MWLGSQTSGAECGFFGHFKQPISPTSVASWPSKAHQKCALEKGAEIWVLNHVIGQPDFVCGKRPFRAPFPGSFCWQQILLSVWGLELQKRQKPAFKKRRRILGAESLVSLMSGAESGLFGHPFQAPSEASMPRFLYGVRPQECVEQKTR